MTRDAWRTAAFSKMLEGVPSTERGVLFRSVASPYCNPGNGRVVRPVSRKEHEIFDIGRVAASDRAKAAAKQVAQEKRTGHAAGEPTGVAVDMDGGEEDTFILATRRAVAHTGHETSPA